MQHSFVDGDPDRTRTDVQPSDEAPSASPSPRETHDCATGWSIAHVYPWQEGQKVALRKPDGTEVIYVREDIFTKAPPSSQAGRPDAE